MSTLVIDELHLIGDQSRGHVLEILLTNALFLKQMKNAEFQIIAMSATFPNLHEVATWLDAELYVTRMRPIAIREYIQTT